MKARPGPAPVFVDAMALCEWTLGRFGNDARVLPRALSRSSLRLVETVSLALQGRGTDARVEEADEQLVVLRVELRVAARVGLLDDAQVVHALGMADSIGRQLGGWMRSRTRTTTSGSGVFVLVPANRPRLSIPVAKTAPCTGLAGAHRPQPAPARSRRLRPSVRAGFSCHALCQGR